MRGSRKPVTRKGLVGSNPTLGAVLKRMIELGLTQGEDPDLRQQKVQFQKRIT